MHILVFMNILSKCLPSHSQAFQVLPEYLQLLDSLSDLWAVQEMSLYVEVN